MTASHAEDLVRHGLTIELARHALLRGWLGPLLLLWAAGAVFLALFWALPLLALAWSGVALLIGVLMAANELRSNEVKRAAITARLERDLQLGALGSPFHRQQLMQNVATFAGIAVRIHASGPGSLDNMHQLLKIQRDAAHEAERSSAWELSPQICQDLGAAWQKLDEQALDGANPGPRFAMDFARATFAALTSMRITLDSREQTSTPAPAPVHEPIPEPPSNMLSERERRELVQMTERALRNLTNPAALARSELMEQLKYTLAAAHATRSASMAGDGSITLLDQVQLLRTVIVAAIEKFRQAGEGAQGEPEALQYLILHDEYVLRRPIRAITTRYSISETALYHHRREGISALAADLAAQEEHLADGVPQATTQA